MALIVLIMINEFNKYNFIKKSESELASDEIFNNLSRKLWNDSGYNVAYMLGIVNYLTSLAKQMRRDDVLTKQYVIKAIAALKEGNETPGEIKNLINIVLEEFKEGENK